MAIRRFAGGLILTLALSTALAADPPPTVVIGTPPQPAWQQLSAQQKLVLAPLVKDWDKMENLRKRKWLGIAERFPAMNSDQQARIQQRMREWASLTPEQRAKVRDTYKDFTQLPDEQKRVVREKWGAYSSLPPEERQRVRENNKSSRLLTPPAQPPVTEGATGDNSVSPLTSTSNPQSKP